MPLLAQVVECLGERHEAIFRARVVVDARGWRLDRDDGPFNSGRGKLRGLFWCKPQTYLVTTPVDCDFWRSVDVTAECDAHGQSAQAFVVPGP